jgi:hypothetical protein
VDNCGIISKVLSAHSAKTLCSALRQCSKALRPGRPDSAAFMQQLQRAVAERTAYYGDYSVWAGISGQPARNIHIYEGDEAYLAFSSSRLKPCSCAEELKCMADSIADFFEKETTRPQAPVLSSGEAVEMLNIIQEKYGFMEVIDDDMELDIYIINRSHICYDSLLLTLKDTAAGTLLNRLMVLSLAPTMDIMACNRYFVFLHEMGHVFYKSVTSGNGKVPFMFRELAVFLGLPFMDDENKLEELFADVFSACAVNNTEYSRYNPFKQVLSGDVMNLLELYFKMLGCQADTRAYYPMAQTFLH